MAKTETNNKIKIISTIFILFIFVISIFIASIGDKSNNISTTGTTEYKSKHYDNIGINKNLLNIIYFNVGQADSTLITINDYTMLIDTGNDSDGYYIADFLKAQNINRIDYLVLTHLDEDHIGGTYKIVEELDIGIIYMPNAETDKQFYKEMMEVLNKKENIVVDRNLIASDDIEYNLR